MKDLGSEFSKYIIKTLKANGFEAYYVGGYVRDLILKRPSSDIDLASSASPLEVKKIFKNIKIYDHGICYGSLTLKKNSETIELTSFRKDLAYKDMRRPSSVILSTKLEDDLARRDFTINAMALDLNGNLFDPYLGREDLKNKIIRAVGNPYERIEEDLLRILRAVRFSAKYDFKIEKTLADAIIKNRWNLQKLSSERIFSEIYKMILADKPSRAFALMKDLKILEVILKDIYLMVDFDQKNPHHDKDLFSHSLAVLDQVPPIDYLRFAALFHDTGKISSQSFKDGIAHYYGHEELSAICLEKNLKSLKAPKKLIQNSKILIENHMTLPHLMKDAGLRRQIRRLGKDLVLALYELLLADRKSSSEGRGFDDILEKRDRVEELMKEKTLNSKKFLKINGRDLIELGFKPGKIFSLILKDMENIVLHNPDLNDKNLLIKIIKEKYMKKLFGTDGIRGVAGDDLTPELAYKLGRALGKILGKENKKILIGKDTRLSGDMLESSLASGLMSMGFNPVLLGICPTPCVAYLVRKTKAAAGIVISASHNPYEYNGIKIFSSSGFKLSDEDEVQIENLILQGIEEKMTGAQIGTCTDGKYLIKDYSDYLKSIVAHDISNLKIGLDFGNGALYKIGEDILKDLGAKVYPLNDKPSGLNINDKCGSTNPNLIKELVLKENLDCGFAFDGDADRIIAIDEKGDTVDGDHLLAIFAKHLKEENKLKNSGLVGTIMTNIGLDKFVDSMELKLLKSKVGDRYVLEDMLKNDYVLGGEQSGHIIFLENNTTGDGMASGLYLLNIMSKTKQKLSDLNKLMTSYPQALVNAKVKKEHMTKVLEDEEIKTAIEKLEKDLKGEGRLVIRPSGTEPLIRVMVEGQDQKNLENLANNLKDLIENRAAKF
ncbi:phosphoglucosamine mutase [Clostridiales bacterium KA00134]|nr:phosphoglucosamine mutase [Clostridiales bacterium KA00134]